MKLNHLIIMGILFTILLLSAGCEYDTPASLWNPDSEGSAPSAIISQVVPADVAGGGVNVIEIHGSNFAAAIEDNVVSFNKVKAEVISAEPAKLVVMRPNLAEEDIEIKVIVPGALEIARISPYKVTQVVENFTERFSDTGNLRAFDIAANGTFYTFMRDKTLRSRLPGSREEVILGEMTERSVGCMRFGPGGDLYYIRDGKQILYRILIAAGTDEVYATFPENLGQFDFADNGTAYVGGSGTGLYAMKSPDDISLAADYTEFTVMAIRVYDNAVYLMAQYTGSDVSIPVMALWKNKITADGLLAARELVFDWTASEYGEAVPADIEFGSDGALFISSNHENPVIKIEGGTVLPLYKGMIPGPVTILRWGHDNYMYLYSDVTLIADKNIYKLDMGQPGAFHYGRE